MKNKPKKKKHSVMYAAILVGVIIVAMSIFFVYSSDQAKMRGEAFGKALEFIQDDLRKLTDAFAGLLSEYAWRDFLNENIVNIASFTEFEAAVPAVS